MNVLLIDFVTKNLPKSILKLSQAYKDHQRTVLLIGQTEQCLHEARCIDGTQKVYALNSKKRLSAQCIVNSIESFCKDYDVIAMPNHTSGRDCLPRLAAKLNTPPITNIIALLDNNTYQRPIYAGNVIETIKNLASKQILTLQTSVLEPLMETQPSCSHDELPLIPSASKVIDLKSSKEDRPDLQNADIIVSGGRGLGSKENFKIIDEFATALGAAVGASRAAVDAEFISNDCQVGQTGKIVAPEVYYAIGISGAVQHLAGMKDSRTIIAINKDPDAPIFKIATYGFVGDLFTTIPELIKLKSK